MQERLAILVSGMPRSMTTWAFNVLRELLERPDAQYLWIAPESAEERAFRDAKGIVLAKCHHFSATLADSADIVVYSYRDIRGAAVSYRRKFGSECTREQLDNWVEAERNWIAHADAVLRYEDVEADPCAGAARLRAILAAKLGPQGVSRATDGEIVDRVERTFREVENAPKVAYDASTMILPAHRTFQPPAEGLPEAERALYERVGADFGDWLSSHGYGGAAELGQELEYEIAAVLIGAQKAPVVVDVGVEHGSFTELALGSGAARVIGFEPLPRHVDYLARRFGSNPAVEMHPFAISRTSGAATLHIATDPAGQELDYHHTLSDLGDTATVIRSRRALEVRTASLADLVRDGVLPADIDLLKVDTDGHDLAVLEGLGPVRPRVIMAEYWDTLPETSGVSEYSLADLARWAERNGYPVMLVARRHGRIQLVQRDAAWSLPGDWGNAFFLRADFSLAEVRARLQSIAQRCHGELCEYVATLMRDIESKEAEIRRLHAATNERDGVIREQGEALSKRDAVIAEQGAALGERDGVIREQGDELTGLRKSLGEREEVIREQEAALTELRLALLTQSEAQPANDGSIPAERQAELMKLLEDKEAVIREHATALKETRRALLGYRGAFVLFSVALVPLNFAASRLRRMFLGGRRLMAPRLGVLVQHEPRALTLAPASSVRSVSREAPPKITIVTPSYNQAQFIERTIRSVVDQEYPSLEYRVQDGGSTDGTVEILRRYGGRLAGWDSRPDKGQSEAINRGFAGTTGEIMAWLNSDDVLFPGALDYVADYFARHPDVDAIYGHRILIDEEDRQIGRWILPAHSDRVLSWADFVPQETLFWRRRIWEKAGGRVDESFRFAMDWDLLLRFREAGARFRRVPRFLGGFRIHSRQKTSAAISDVGFQEMNRLRERVLGRVPSGDEVRKALVPYVLRHLAADVPWKIRDGLATVGARA